MTLPEKLCHLVFIPGRDAARRNEHIPYDKKSVSLRDNSLPVTPCFIRKFFCRSDGSSPVTIRDFYYNCVTACSML